MSKLRSPCCNAKTSEGGKGLRRCVKCGGRFDPAEIASGRIEGGTCGHRPDMRLIMEEEGGPTGAPIRMNQQLKGGLNERH